ncbi:hypothetical protein C4901_08225 [Acidiferrobacter sp. SPIII_3]|jgi:phosphatidylserine/phosphatidylglycerophosphate/cardiolipin synthase-like enzyme/uncharacterized membrane protein YdjX (TVP38/TMEM64 family)|uniref:VTT domain-containing protein n=1 Tax=Acidiferrobacter sp. SPIII_3 TaxID=1281578 RepID=UPI000D731786|nr:VTT domain-containing protein [Acidiferrobacter sp. SPIII_3]AWP23324.1 hypothetical protein C4901_08225 [Acidiferrobacter sp. SPIII_3]
MDTLFAEGRNCWRIVSAEAVAFLIDGEAYFRAFQEAACTAEDTILISGWDVDSRMALDGAGDGRPDNRLGPFLDTLIRRKPGVHAFLLNWDFSLIFALEREPFPAFKLGWRTHKRLHFHLDGHHPPAGSHHQKIVVVDDRMAFAGGLDLTIHRWDTRAHRAHDKRRMGPAGRPYGPFHDVQIAVSGPAARALGDLVRSRWHEATGERIPAPRARSPATWALSAAPLLHHVPVAISRTRGRYEGHAGVDEIRHLYRDALARAREVVYIENQYLTAAAVGDALRALLQRADPPEIIIVLPLSIPGWLQRHTMGVLRDRLLAQLRAADHKHRLRACYPVVPGLAGDCVKVHSKVLIVDDTFVTVGSANINNRSMGLDSECNISIDGLQDPRIATAIDALRCDLLGEHLGLSEADARQYRREAGSWTAVIDARCDAPRHLEPLPDRAHDALSPLADSLIADPERPVAAPEFIASYVPESARAHLATRLLRNTLILTGFATLGAIWHYTPLHVWLDVPRLIALLRTASRYAAAPLALWGAYLIGGLSFFPVTLLIVVTALAFTPPQNLLYAFLGCLSSASLNYALGRILGGRILHRLAPRAFRELHHRLRRPGLGTMILVSTVPIAPFTVVTVGAGALKVRYRDLVIGTTVGVTPGILLLTLFTGSLASTLDHPATKHILLLAVIAVALAALALGLRRWLAEHFTKPGSTACARK